MPPRRERRRLDVEIERIGVDLRSAAVAATIAAIAAVVVIVVAAAGGERHQHRGGDGPRRASERQVITSPWFTERHAPLRRSAARAHVAGAVPHMHVRLHPLGREGEAAAGAGRMRS